MKKRILTAIIMTLVVLPFALIGGSIFKFGISIVALLGLNEVWNLKKTHKKYPMAIKVLSMISLIIILLVENNIFNPINYHLLVYGFNTFIIIVPIFLVLLPTVFYGDKYNSKDACSLLGFIILLGIGFRSIVLIRDQSIMHLIYVLLISILNEMFGLFTGMLIGKHKLLPEVSPKKTIEGAIGGLVIGSIAAIVFAHLLLYKISIKLVVCTVVLGLVGQIGDLFFSKIKRENDIKDFSNLLPGHGGILDRFDSLIWVAMLYVVLFI
jgi:phosphatidate cytidylyltransferase